MIDHRRGDAGGVLVDEAGLPAMDQGAILEQGSPEEIFGAPKSTRLGEFLANVSH